MCWARVLCAKISSQDCIGAFKPITLKAKERKAYRAFRFIKQWAVTKQKKKDIKKKDKADT